MPNLIPSTPKRRPNLIAAALTVVTGVPIGVLLTSAVGSPVLGMFLGLWAGTAVGAVVSTLRTHSE